MVDDISGVVCSLTLTIKKFPQNLLKVALIFTAPDVTTLSTNLNIKIWGSRRTPPIASALVQLSTCTNFLKQVEGVCIVREYVGLQEVAAKFDP